MAARAQQVMPNCSDPAKIHGMDMPGVNELEQGAARVTVVYAQTPGGAQITYTSTEQTLISALHAGFAGVEIEACTPTITLGGGGTLAETVEFLLGTGIARALLDPVPPDARGRAIDAVTDALASHYEADHGVRLGSAAWLVSATR